MAEEPSPVPRDTDHPDPEQFTELISTCQQFRRKEHHFSPAASPSEPRYAVKIRLLHSKPEVELHQGAETTGPIVGVVKLRIGSQDLGLGDPNRILEEGDGNEHGMVWEKLKKCNKWNYKEYEFEFGVGQDRKTYTWRRTHTWHYGKMKAMELRVGGREETNGQLIALWKNIHKHVMRRGSLFIKRDIEGESESSASKVQTMVILSMLAIVETAIRRQ